MKGFRTDKSILARLGDGGGQQLAGCAAGDAVGALDQHQNIPHQSFLSI
jgi:hypothetical protein